MAIVFATGSFMSMVAGNTGGNLQQLPDQRVGAKPHLWTERITLAAQVSGANIPIARVPIGSALLAISVNSTVSLGTSTIAFGDMNNTARFTAAAVFTAVDVATQKLNATWQGALLTTVYDYLGTANDRYEDIIMTIAAAAFPASGTLVTTVVYQDFGV